MDTIQNLRLGILDLSPRKKNGSDIEAIQETLEVAKVADSLGFHRFWVSEHHNHNGLINTSPELLMCHIAGITKRIRVGSGGIMLPNYSPLKVAEWIRTLESLFPGRMDFGLGRATGSDPGTASLLNPSSSMDCKEFEAALELLHSLLLDRSPLSFEGKAILAHPLVQFIPNIWIFSTSGGSAASASKLEIPISFAHFMNPDKSEEILTRNQSQNFNTRSSLAVMAICAETEEVANDMCLSMQYALFQIERNDSEGVLSFKEVQSLNLSTPEKRRLGYFKNRIVSGTPKSVKKQLIRLAAVHRVEELLIITVSHELKDRIRSYELIAKTFNLGEQCN